MLRQEIYLYRSVKVHWGLGHVQCVVHRVPCGVCGQIHMPRVYGHYKDIAYVKKRQFLGHGLSQAFINVDDAKRSVSTLLCISRFTRFFSEPLTMHLQTKLELMKHTDSYWLILPYEIRELIVKYKESQELIEWRESEVSRALCQQIILYREVQYTWFIGPIQCQCVRTRVWGQDVIEMRVFGYYWNLNGEKKR